MKLKRFVRLGSAFILSISTLLTVGFTGTAFAAPYTCTWTGGGDGTSFSDASNWSNCSSAAPVSGDSLVFDVTNIASGNVDTSTSDGYYNDWVLNNDISGLSLSGITFQGTNSNYYEYALTGDGITLDGNITVNADSALDLPVTLGANTAVVSGTNSQVFTIGNSEGAATVFNTGGYTLSFTGVGGSCGIYDNDELEGSGSVTVNMPNGGLTLNTAADNYTGAVSVSGGILGLGSATALGSTSGVTVASGSTLSLGLGQANATYSFPLTLGGSGANSLTGALEVDQFAKPGCSGGPDESTYTATLTGPVTLTSDTVYSGYYNTNITGTYTSNGYSISTLSGSEGNITYPGGSSSAAAQTITVAAGDNQPNLGVTVGNKQTYIINGQRGGTEVQNGGTLKGTGQVGQLGVDQGGIVSPGDAPGCLTVDGDLNEGGTYQAEIGGTTACSGYDQLIVTSSNTVSLDDFEGTDTGQLQVSLISGFVPKAGETFEIINNEGSQPIQGTFANFPEGSEITVNNIVFKISYVGGDGNDVALTVVKVPGTPDTGFGLTADHAYISMTISVLAAGAIWFAARRVRPVSNRK